MSEAGDEGVEGGGESKQVGNEAEKKPLWERPGADTSPVRGRKQTTARPAPGQDAAFTLPDDDPFWDEDDLFQTDEFKPILESLYGFLRDPLGEAGATRAEPASRKVPSRPARPRRTPGTGGSRRKGRRRSQRWGRAVRQAAMEEIASGGPLGRRSLRAIREAVPLSQRELAYQTRLSRSTISEIEQGRRRPHPRTMRMIAAVLRVKVWEIEWG
jgi:DNA-binding XRE family transcriptional regulator